MTNKPFWYFHSKFLRRSVGWFWIDALIIGAWLVGAIIYIALTVEN